MRKATAIIGANWGDEGKGLMVDRLANEDTVVVRFNGGAQAGHTVCTPDGKRHVFHHFGSGTLRGARTYLSEFFVCNPLLFNEELAELVKLFGYPKVAISHDSLMTTPWDMMINQIAEESRGMLRHGSCGVGINETIVRSEAIKITAGQHDVSLIRSVQDLWVSRRLEQLGIEPSRGWCDRLYGSETLINFQHEIAEMMTYAKRLDDRYMSTWQPFMPLLFEGAQGLQLDQNNVRDMPFLTRSNTGAQNVATLCKKWGVDTVDAVYVTRSYATRHGPGPFPGEIKGWLMPDRTNAPNDWQGTMRFGSLNENLMYETISSDLTHLDGMHGTPALAVTHLDQFNINAVGLSARMGFDRTYLSFGPTRENVARADHG